VTPGITIRDRLRVLLPNDPQTFYRTMDLVTPEQLDRLQTAAIEITNYHAFIRREKEQAAALTKKILAGPDGDLERFKETPGEMVRRVCRVFGNAKDVIVLNDEAHHCYTPAPPEVALEGALDADERTEAKQNAEEARVWFEGLRAVRDDGVRRSSTLRHPVLPQGLRLCRGHAVSVGRERLRAHGRHRERDREGAAGANRGRLDGRRHAEVPRPLGPRARRAPTQGPP
jgi:hypothetical protein